MICLWFGLLLFIFQFVNVAFSTTQCDCSKWEVTIAPPKCGKNNNAVIQQNCTAFLSPDCQMYFNGCLCVKDHFETARIVYEVKASYLSLFKADDMVNGDDLCSEIQMFDIGSALGVSCPITEDNQCICSTGDTSLLNISNYCDLIPIAIAACGGKVVATAKVQYDGCGPKDTFEITITVAEVKKKKKKNA